MNIKEDPASQRVSVKKCISGELKPNQMNIKEDPTSQRLSVQS